jgi:ribonuclease HII
MRILGLDEAGRGSVLGPLVVGAFCAVCTADDNDPAGQASLRSAGADDSKVLTPARRAAALARLCVLGEVRTLSIAPASIDDGNVNDLEVAAFLEHVAHFRPDRVYLDAPVNPRGIPALRRRLQRASGVDDWVVEPKADATWPVVGAASIAAKIERDLAIERLGEVGSGYPSDPVTRRHLSALLRSGAALPDYVRTRWATLDSLRQQALFGAI